jgi:L-lactate dehydrogenase
MTATPRHDATALVDFAHALLARAGVRDDIARTTAEVLVDGDLMGHTTHGLALLAGYLGELERGTMRKSGEPAMIAQRPAAQTWDGKRLPGPWLTVRALDAAIDMARTAGTGTVVIRRSHHIACLAAYARRATERGFAALVLSSDPSVCSVAPFGAVSPVFTPNPLAAGLPTGGDPVLLDISASLTTNGLTARLHAVGERLPHPWVQDARGNATDDPGVLFREPKGTLLPLGGLDAGHKGYALALLVEALTAGLAGFGRADPAEGWGATVFVQALDPEAFGGRAAFVRQMDWIGAACRTATPRPGTQGARLPGERAVALARAQARDGVALHATILPALAAWAARYDVGVPEALVD